MRAAIEDLRSYIAGTGIDDFFKGEVVKILLGLEDRIRKIELERAAPGSKAFERAHTRDGFEADAENERLEALRESERKRREELAEVNERLARWGL